MYSSNWVVAKYVFIGSAFSLFVKYCKPASFSTKFKDYFLQEVVPKVYNTGLVKSVPL